MTIVGVLFYVEFGLFFILFSFLIWTMFESFFVISHVKSSVPDKRKLHTMFFGRSRKENQAITDFMKTDEKAMRGVKKFHARMAVVVGMMAVMAVLMVVIMVVAAKTGEWK